ncbi:hypothetical protein H2200_011524 [Cladophialophora chaetospira]|uniref:Uncharacterized protein n=1 Tax=Cladophialophora chaetospira TaxID=386627 RepID=A0AA38WZH1_9EURO|nr:hypothetical protein H2200_011524 [Cladophialophora chaetospira]
MDQATSDDVPQDMIQDASTNEVELTDQQKRHKEAKIFRQEPVTDVKFHKMAFQQPMFSAFQEGDVFVHRDGRRIKLVYQQVKIKGDEVSRLYRPPKESLGFVDGNGNYLPGFALATGPDEMEQLVGVQGEDRAGVWKRWNLIRPNDQQVEEDLGTLDDIRIKWNNRWPMREQTTDGSMQGPSNANDEDEAGGTRGDSRKRKSTSEAAVRASARAATTSGATMSQGIQSTQRESMQPEGLLASQSTTASYSPIPPTSFERTPHGNDYASNSQQPLLFAPTVPNQTEGHLLPQQSTYPPSISAGAFPTSYGPSSHQNQSDRTQQAAVLTSQNTQSNEYQQEEEMGDVNDDDAEFEVDEDYNPSYQR